MTRFLLKPTCWCCLLMYFLFAPASRANTPRFTYFGRKSNTTASPPTKHVSDSSSSWTSFLPMNPAKIMSTLIHRGGLILPKSIQEELLAVSKICNVDDAQWNLLQRRLLFLNFTVTLPGDDYHALKVGRVEVTWGSYTKPIINLEIDDVDVLLEFANLLLTKNNWDELKEAGFPPTMMSEGDYKNEPPPPSSYSYVRIGSVDLSGFFRARVRSRPLDQEVCPPWTMDLNVIDAWNEELRRLSDENLKQTGRGGCTTTQFYDWIQRHVSEKFREILKATAYDLISQPFQENDTDTVKKVKGFLYRAKETAYSYVQQATKKSGENFYRDHIERRVQSIKPLQEQIQRLNLTEVLDTQNTTDQESSKTFNAMYQSLRETAAGQLEHVMGAFRALENADVGEPEIILPDQP